MTLLSRDRTFLYQQPIAVITTGFMSSLVREQVRQSQERTYAVQLVDRRRLHGPFQIVRIDTPQLFRMSRYKAPTVRLPSAL